MLPAIGLLLVLALVAAGGRGRKRTPAPAPFVETVRYETETPPAYWVLDEAGKAVPVPGDVAGDAIDMAKEALARCPARKEELREAVLRFADGVAGDPGGALVELQKELEAICA